MAGWLRVFVVSVGTNASSQVAGTAAKPPAQKTTEERREELHKLRMDIMQAGVPTDSIDAMILSLGIADAPRLPHL